MENNPDESIHLGATTKIQRTVSGSYSYNLMINTKGTDAGNVNATKSLAISRQIGTQVDPDQIVMFSNGDIFSKGRICSRYMRVSIDNPCSAPDYVFENNYKLMPLNEVDVYIKKYKHLPEVPSALEFHQNGMDVAEMNFIMLKKVEELTLHLIEVSKRLQTVERENAELKERLNR